MTSEPYTEQEAQQQEIARDMAWLGAPDITSVLANVTRPEESRRIESVSAAAIAWAKEQQDYEMLVNATRAYILARRKTTELCIEERTRNLDVTLSEIGFTRMQWLRRKREYEIEQERLDSYFDAVVANGWMPSAKDLMRFVSGKAEGGTVDEYERDCNILHAVSGRLLASGDKRITDAQRKEAGRVRKVFELEAIAQEAVASDTEATK